MIILIFHWDFEFVEELRMYRMGWAEGEDVDSNTGYPWIMAWIGISMTFTCIPLSFYAHIKDRKFAKTYKMRKLKHAVKNGNGYSSS